MIILAQTSSGPISLGAAIFLASVALVIGVITGYLLGYRFKRQYLNVARQLANLRGENFRGEVATIGIPRPGSPGARPPSSPSAPSSALPDEEKPCQRCIGLKSENDRLTETVAEARATATQLEQRVTQLEAEKQEAIQQIDAIQSQEAEQPMTESEPASDYQWQIQQLHREQIAMQMKMDEYIEEIARLTEQLNG